MTLMHPARRQQLDQLARKDPATEWHDVYRTTMLWEFPQEARLGFQLAFYRPLAVPRMAAVLASTGHLQQETTRRAYDTGLVMHEVIYHGFDHPRGQKMIRLMNALHNRPDVTQPDLTYVLNSLIVVPSRFIARVGWRPLTEVEETAAWRFYRELGERMHIEQLPTSYAAAVADFDEYEGRELGSSTQGAELTAATLRALDERLPGPLKGHGAAITSALLNDPRFSAAISLPKPRASLVALARLGLRARGLRRRVTRPSAQGSFTPGQPAGSVYPNGYQLDELGPTPH